MELTELVLTLKIPATIVHVVAVVFGMGSALVSDLLFSFFSKDKHLNKTEMSTLSILATAVFYSLILISLSGLIIFLSDIEKYSHSAKFLAKISILAILIINGYVLNKYVWPHLLNKNFFTLKKERNIRKLAFGSGAISVISWLSVCALGVLDSLNMPYVAIVSLYASIIVLGTIVALVIERKEFN
ncbi:MAG: hypothetical protein KBD55_00495 [Candidatus Pacebacteria bacterium]|nr:hypothetical protein [Candidatus Paceibacterota bacterium]